jgi:hypothetical protein
VQIPRQRQRQNDPRITMKNWLTKWRISNAVDGGQPLPTTVAPMLAQSADLREFVANTRALELALRNSRPAPATSQALHASIMRAIQSAEPARARAFAWAEFRSRLIPAAALSLVLLLGVFGAGHFGKNTEVLANPAASRSLAAAGSAMEISGQLMRVLPDAALSPLNQERQSLNRDLANAQAFLLASLP